MTVSLHFFFLLQFITILQLVQWIVPLFIDLFFPKMEIFGCIQVNTY